MVSQVDIEGWTRIYHIKKEEGILHGSNGMNTVKQNKPDTFKLDQNISSNVKVPTL